jgi:hypothetical protein
MLETFPAAAPSGLFEPVIGPAPEEWPWAFPHLYAVNFAPEETPEDAPEETPKDAKGWRVESIGFWDGRFHVVDSAAFAQRDVAEKAASDAFDGVPTRLLMDRGTVTKTNLAVQVTGRWPERWTFRRPSELRVFCAFLYDLAATRGGRARADEFRALASRASPASEQVLVYIRALEAGRALLGPFVSSKARAELENALKSARRLLR